jgi:tetratricopeptide (TPR) repeat protein
MRCAIEPGPGYHLLLSRAHRVAGFIVAALVAFISHAHALELDEARALVQKGSYAEAISAAEEAIKATPEQPDWWLLEAEARASTGQYAEAEQSLNTALARFPLHLRLRLAAYAIERTLGNLREAKAQLSEVERLGTSREWAYRSPLDRLALGRAALLLGADPQRVLQVFFDPVQKEHPDIRDSYLASGELALEKSDFALAAKTFGAGVKKFANDADMWLGLARAHAPSDAAESLRALEKTLENNPHHTGAQLQLADHFIDAEEYAKADEALTVALKTNPHLAEAHSYRAVVAHLRNDERAERQERAAALKLWSNNPNVPHLIGRKLSQKYRFAEGAALQREALKFDGTFLPAKAQLASDLLRLGDDKEGWRLADEVQTADPYDVVAYNLTVLRDVLAKFRTLQSPHFILRMDAREARIYGDKALALLERAHQTITKKYGLDLKDRTIVEVFPDQKDFAIRTFGLPGGSGYLGVCFGRVITANSPASRAGSPANWEAVLWHEFTHVVTLTLTKNKMPRWLSEGISVFEERQARGSWGEQMKPRYRAMILGEDLTPVSDLSAAFLKPKSSVHLGFAYYESSLVVEWLIERWGLPKMKALLADLAQGSEINAALAKAFAPIDKLDSDFAAHAKELANHTAPKLDWTKPAPAQLASAKALNDLLSEHPNNFVGLTQQAQQLIKARQWDAAKVPLKKLIELYPNQHDEDGAYAMLALVHRELGETDAEFSVLTKLADLASDDTDTFLRLMQICAERHDWEKVVDYAARFAAVDPLRPEPHRFKADAAEALKRNDEAMVAYRALLELQPADPADVHFKLARLLHQRADPEAKRHVLLALEEAPRFRAAHELLLDIVGSPSSRSTPVKSPPSPQATPPPTPPATSTNPPPR